MTYSENGETITLEMSRDDYMQLILMLGTAAGSVFDNKKLFWAWNDFTNRLNIGNPHYTPYEIPEEFKSNFGWYQPHA